MTTTAEFWWVLDCMAIFAEMLPVLSFTIIEIRAKYLIVTHIATETLSMICHPLCANRLTHDSFAASPALRSSFFGARHTSQTVLMEMIGAIDWMPAITTSEAFWMISATFCRNRFALYLVATSNTLRSKPLVAALAAETLLLVEKVSTRDFLGTLIASKALIVISMSICINGSALD
jgi:hypothetical protein